MFASIVSSDNVGVERQRRLFPTDVGIAAAAEISSKAQTTLAIFAGAGNGQWWYPPGCCERLEEAPRRYVSARAATLPK